VLPRIETELDLIDRVELDKDTGKYRFKESEL